MFIPNPRTKTLNPDPRTLNPDPRTLNPKPQNPQELECNIRCRVGNLRQRLQRSEVLQLQQNLTLALALEDFVKARGMSSDLSQARLAARSSSSPHLRRLERVCMMHGMQQRLALRRLRQNSLASAIQWRVRWLRARTEEEKKDRVLCLEHAIAAMVAEERYNEAGHSHPPTPLPQPPSPNPFSS
jgi:hypothetical protein